VRKRRLKGYKLVCILCKVEFEPFVKNQRFCCAEHRKEHHENLHRAKALTDLEIKLKQEENLKLAEEYDRKMAEALK
jgi:protein-arginine kinase activator protein McsA